MTEKVLIKVRGVVTEPRCWAARYFADFAVTTVPTRYSLDIKFLFEMEWIYMKRMLTGEDVEVPGMGEPMCAVWANEEFVGDDIALCKYLLKDGYIPENTMYDILQVEVKISTDPIDYCPRNLERAYVYFDIEVDGRNIGRMLFEIFTDLMPLSCERFLNECKRYDNCAVHRIAQNGWFESGKFDKEKPPLREKRPPGLSNCREGMISLINTGQTNCKSSQFLITFFPATFLDPFQCPIGVLLDGEEILQKINKLNTHYDAPLHDIKLINVSIFYAPKHFIESNNLVTMKTCRKPAKVWIDEEALMRKIPGEIEEIKKYRIDLKPKYEQIVDEVDSKLNKIRLHLYKENKKLQEFIDEPRFKNIVKSVLRKEKRLKEKVKKRSDDDGIRKVEQEKWYNILVNADSDFDLYYKPPGVPHIAEETKDIHLYNMSVIDNPDIIHLMQYVNKRELRKVMDLIKSIMDKAINEAIQFDGANIYLEHPPTEDITELLGEDLQRLPESMQDLLVDKLCSMTNSAIDLFHLTLKHILETVSSTKIEETSTISGNVLMIVNATKSFLQHFSLSESDVVKRQESLTEDIQVLEESMVNVHLRVRSDPLPVREWSIDTGNLWAASRRTI